MASDDGVVVIGVNESQLPLLGQCKRMGARFFQRIAMQDHLGPKTARALHLDARRKARHHDDSMQAQPLGVVGHTLGMVACAHGNNAARRLLGR